MLLCEARGLIQYNIDCTSLRQAHFQAARGQTTQQPQPCLSSTPSTSPPPSLPLHSLTTPTPPPRLASPLLTMVTLKPSLSPQPAPPQSLLPSPSPSPSSSASAPPSNPPTPPHLTSFLTQTPPKYPPPPPPTSSPPSTPPPQCNLNSIQRPSNRSSPPSWPASTPLSSRTGRREVARVTLWVSSVGSEEIIQIAKHSDRMPLPSPPPTTLPPRLPSPSFAFLRLRFTPSLLS